MSDLGALILAFAIMVAGFVARPETFDLEKSAHIIAEAHYNAVERAAQVQADAIDRYVRVQERLVQIQLRIAVSQEEATEILRERAAKR